MSNLYTQQDSNLWKTWGLMTAFLVLVILAGWIFSQVFNSSLILYVAVVAALLANIFSYWYADKIVLKLHKAHPVTREEHFDLYNITENLAITAGLPMPGLYIIEDRAPNAFATGRDPEHGVVCVTTGLLAILNKQELEGVIAHELSHIGNRDILLSTVVVVLAGFIAILSDLFLRSQLYGIGRDRDNKVGAGMMVLGIAFAILAPLVALVIRLAVSRKREFLADASGALLTRYPEGLASALEKISSSPVPLRTARNATAHLFISNPFRASGTKTSMMTKLFMTHPPVEERIRALTEGR